MRRGGVNGAGAIGRRLRAVLPDRRTLATMRRDPRRDLLAGLTVAIVALPLALGFGVSSGAGAAAGLATAVVAGAIAAVFGGSGLQVTGPTGAMTVVLVPIVARYGTGGVLTVGLLAGLLLVLLALAGAGRWMAYVPVPVIEGFTVGIAGVIGLQQVPGALGVAKPDGENPAVVAARAVSAFASSPHWAAVLLAAGVAALMLIGGRLRPGVPFSLIAVVAATVLAKAVDLPVAVIGHLPSGLPSPSLGFLDLSAVPALLPSALAVAALGALESLMSATAADAMTANDPRRGGERHDSDRELFGQGLANLVAPLFGGVAATGAIARTAVNVRSGAVSRLAALVHAAVLAVVVFAAAPLVADIPLAALAGVLIATAVRMVQAGALRALARTGRGEAAVLAATAAATLAFDLVTAVAVGLLLAGALALRAVARAARLERLPVSEQDHAGGRIAAYRLHGPLLFAAAHRLRLELTAADHAEVVILRMSRVTAIDASGATVLGEALADLHRRGIRVLLSGLHPEHRRPLDALGILDELQAQGRLFATTPEALAYARDTLPTVPAPAVGTR
ncbi:SulP family inorganic anion transporter [Kitasatospora griseola]|uniref:SulP family inorganic anion transporter n=1 Tax=Kitasatospora griseola TaxID=2064 RepID=UPI0036483290